MSVPEDEKLCDETGYRIYYFSFMRPALREFYMEDDIRNKVEIIDTWNMTITDAGVHSGRFCLELPGRQYIVVRLRKV
ncbi:DUF5605 domain-containing protein [Butyrivibrio sp. WCE2006]|uniref:DUF5605 domain-containing protein n=1 Tax=Butyrivibrio sp. WCE2006 TaxID=1410611 RepID=UPI0005D23B56|nr:DUF5605 domain-containing protein [Butyrivibrio sp. WCE2006]